MLFTDHFFILYFFPIFILIYYLIASKALKPLNLLIIIFSIIFYASFGIINLPILVLPIIYDYFIGLYLSKHLSKRRAKYVLIFSISLYLLILAYFKYALFTTNILTGLKPHSTMLASLETFFTTLLIPVGISFITFQRISYLVDIYRKSIKPSKNFIQFATYELLFPHLISGPIVRFADIKDQLKKRIINANTVFTGMKYFVIGLGLKVLVADQLFSVEKMLTANINNIHFFEALSIIFYFSFRIYTDFCGYSLIAIGLAKLIGFDFPHNFNAPYQSESVTQFWRRWNITLSNWIRDYLYIPLGGNRKGNVRTYVNLMITMMLAGLWHGANWNFVIWGGLHGLYLSIERFSSHHKISLPIPLIMKRMLVFIIISITWLTFLFTKPGEIITVLYALVSFQFVPLSKEVVHIMTMTSIPLFIAILWSFILGERWIDKLKPSLIISSLLIILFCISLYATLWNSGVNFIYFQF